MSRNTRTLAMAVVLALCIGGALTGCKKSDSDKKTVRLSTSKNVWCSLAIIADVKGFFDAEGLDVDVSYTDGGRYCMDALLSGSAEAGNIVETNVSYLGYTGNRNIVVIGNVVESTSVAIVARRSSGIGELGDLVGKRLAFAPAMQGEIFAHRVLAKHGLDIGQINIQKLQPKAIPSALDSGAIDAASTWEPFVYACTKALGSDAIVFRDPLAHKGYMHLAVRRDWAEKNPDVAKALLRAFQRAGDFVRQHPDEAKKILVEQMHVDIDLVNAIWPHFNIALTMDGADDLQPCEKCEEDICEVCFEQDGCGWCQVIFFVGEDEEDG